MQKPVRWLAAALALAGIAMTTPVQANTALSFCNATPTKAFVAIVYYQTATQKWILSAWHGVEGNGCQALGAYAKGKVFYYAEHAPDKLHWPAKDKAAKTYCVPNSRVERTMLGGACATGERNVGFGEIAVSGDGAFKFTLNK